MYRLELCFAKWACDRLTKDADFSKKKKKIFSDEAHCGLGRYVNKLNFHISGIENSHAYIEKPKHPKRVTVWCEFWSRGITKPVFIEYEREAVTVNGHVQAMFFFTNFCSQKLKRRILATFDFNRTALRALQPKLHSMFCALFLKITLSAAELISFSHLGAAI